MNSSEKQKYEEIIDEEETEEEEETILDENITPYLTNITNSSIAMINSE